MPINQFNDFPWERRESAEGSDRYERELDRRYRMSQAERCVRDDSDLILSEDDGYREWCETIEKEEQEQNES